MKMTKKHFNEEEIQEILESLFAEKKRNKELQRECEGLRKSLDAAVLDKMRAEATKDDSQLIAERAKNHSLLEDFKENSLYIGKLQQELLVAKRQLKSVQETQTAYIQDIENLSSSIQEKEQQFHQFQHIQNDFELLKEQCQEVQDLLDKERIKLKTFKDEKEHLQQQLADSRLHAEQLERGIQYLRGKLEEANTDKDLLGEELLETQNALQNNSQDIELLKKQSEDKEAALEELNAIRLQFEQLKAMIRLHKKEAEDRAIALAHAENQARHFQEENQRLEHTLEKRAAKISQAEQELGALKQALQQKTHDLEEWEHQYRALTTEKLQQVQAVENQTRQLLSLQEQLQESLLARKALENASVEKAQLQGQCSVLEQQLQEAFKQLEEALKTKTDADSKRQRLQELLSEKERLLEALNGQFSVLNQDKQRLQETVYSLQSQMDEKEGQIRIAQQHFGKKMKETAALQERLEEQRIQILEMQGQVQSSQAKLVELRNAAETRQMQEKRLEDMLNESTKSASRWEEKYFIAANKAQEFEERYLELKKIEERYYHLQNMIASLGSALERPPAASPIRPDPVSTPAPVQAPFEAPITPSSTSNPVDLFQPPNPPQAKFKQTFFDP